MKNLFVLLFIVTFCGSALSQDGYRPYMYNGPGNGVDNARSVCMDRFGDFYVTGNSYGGSSTDMDYCTIKYSRYDGQRFLWVARFNGTGSYTDQANAIVSDIEGNVYVTGWAHMEPVGLDCGTIDWVTIKYNTDGVQQWASVYNGPSNGQDYANAIFIDGVGNVYVTGSSQSSAGGEDFTTIKYNNSGVQLWVARYNGPSSGDDCGRSLDVDASGNVYVCGDSYKSGQGADFVTIKYNSAGVQQWVNRENGTGNGNDTAFVVSVDKAGNVVVTGTEKNTNQDYLTVKYSPSGSTIWKKVYNGTGNGTDEAQGMTLDAYDNVYVTGFSMGTSNYDYATIKYISDGTQAWVKRYNGPANLNDKAFAMTISTKEITGQRKYFIYVTGTSQRTSSAYDYLSIKYNPDGDTVWTKRYNSNGTGVDVPNAIAVLATYDYIYVTGTANNDYCSVMYYPKTVTPTDNPVTGNGNQKILQNYPNPFNPTTKIEFKVTEDANVSIRVYDMLGRVVAELVNQKLEAGPYEVNWNASEFPSGTYFYTMEENGVKVDTKRMLLIK